MFLKFPVLEAKTMKAIPQRIIAALEAKGHPMDKIGTFDNPIPQDVLIGDEAFDLIDAGIVIDLRAPEDK